MVSQSRYTPFGETRWTSGAVVTDFGYTGQRNDGFGLLDYRARFYDPSIMQWTQPDTLIPDPYNPLDWDRYQYVRSNPLRYTDPSGHVVSDGGTDEGLPSLEELKEKLKKKYDVELSDEGDFTWTLPKALRIYYSVYNMQSSMYGTNFSEEFGSTKIKLMKSSEEGKSGGIVNHLKMQLWGNFSVKLVYHEFGHIYNNFHNSSPEQKLASYGGGIQVDGVTIAGIVDGKYLRTYEGIYGGDVMHGIDWLPDGPTPFEDFADMFMFWVMGRDAFRPGAAGDARYNWMNSVIWP